MSAIRLAARARPSVSSLRATPILQRAPVLALSSPLTRRSPIASTPSTTASSRRWASSAAAVKEVEEEDAPEEKKWPERILPDLTEVDKSRLKRQRNVGMCVVADFGDLR